MVFKSTNTIVRDPAVAGLFYSAEPSALQDDVAQLLADAPLPTSVAPEAVKALIAPHAGYIYSGGVAAAAYKYIESRREAIRRVVLVGPSHRVYFQGISVPQVEVFATPLGEIPLDRQRIRDLAGSGEVLASDAPHAMEHSLEVHLPFLQVALHEFTVVPMVTGATTAAHVARVLSQVWGDGDTLIVASSDLSHYLTYSQAQRMDAQTSAKILSRTATLQPEEACGALPINAVLTAAIARGLQVSEIARLNSGDTAGDKARVVGYGAYALH